MYTRHTLVRLISVSFMMTVLFSGCFGCERANSFMPDPPPRTAAEMRAVVDSLRQVVRPSFTDRSPIVGVWEVMNVILTPVSVITQDEAFDIMGQLLIYTRNKVVLFDHACANTTYSIKHVSFISYFRDHELRRNELQLENDLIEVITASCDGEEWDVAGAELVRVNRERLLILWDGSVIVLVPQVW